MTQELPWEGPDQLDRPMRGRMTEADAVEKFILAGNATITLRSVATGMRWTFRIRKPDDFKGDRPIWFVSVLKGEDNENDYGYIGQIRGQAMPHYERGRKCWPSFFNASDGFMWFSRWLFERDVVPPSVEVWHEGRCGRCNRKLTVPESIESGFGPECIGRV